jgi:hypothetical protein
MSVKQAKPLNALFYSVIGFFLILCLDLPSAAQSQNYTFQWNNGVTESWWVDLNAITRPELDAGIERWRLIQAENDNSRSHQWAGDYFSGSDTHGTYMRWSPQAGFVLAHVDKCAASLMGLSYGTVRISPTSVEFIFEYQRSLRSHGHGQAHTPTLSIIKFVPIRWDNIQYLVREDEMADFGDYVGGFGRYNQEYGLLDYIPFFSRSIGEGENNYEGLPQVPPGYERFIRRPIDAVITAVGRPRLRRSSDAVGTWHYWQHTPVSVNVGSANGVERGMFFRVLSSDQGETVKIVQVGRRSSTGVIIRWVDENRRVMGRYPRIRVGWLLTTSIHR